MSRLLALVPAALLLAGAVSQQPAAPSGAPAPLLRVEPASFDFGRARPGSTLRKAFTVRNAGEADLVLKRVSTSCGCTAAILGETTLKPGRSTSLTVSLATGRSPGRIERHVLLSSNDPKTPLVDVGVQATVVAAEEK